MKQLLLILGLAAFLVMWLSYSSLEILGDSTNRSSHTSLTQRLRQSHSLTAKLNSNELLPQTSFMDRRNQSCKPKHHIFFLKTHKCASSTVQNILMRYAERYGTSLVLPAVRNYLGYPAHFRHDMALPPPPPNKTYDFFCHHSRFQPNEVQGIMPVDTLYFTILRDPVMLFESLFSYYDLAQKWGIEMVDLPPKSGVNLSRASEGKFGRNQMLFDLGMEEADFDNATAVKKFIDEISKRFDLVMFAERFDESLILMKELLCWQLEDIISFRQNTRMDGTRRPISESVAKRLRQWNGADQQLYDHFAAEFDKKVQHFGTGKMADEVAELRRWNNAWYGQCVQREANASELGPKYRTWSSKVLGFHLRPNVKSRMCEGLAKTEIAFTDELRSRQIKRSKNPPMWGTTFQLFL